MFIRPNTTIGENLRKRSKHDKVVYKARLTYSLKCLRFLLQQWLACRGHNESEESLNRGNFLELLNWLARNFKEVNEVVLKNAPKNCKMTSPRIQKQLIRCCATETTKLLMEDLGDEFFFQLLLMSLVMCIKMSSWHFACVMLTRKGGWLSAFLVLCMLRILQL